MTSVTERDLRKHYLALAKSMSPEKLQQALAEAWTNLAFDPLTGVCSKAFFRDQLQREIARAKRYGHPLALAMIDCDNLKQVNDSFGHEIGDHMLKELAVILKANSRAADIVFRYGGDEFGIIMPETELKGACAHVETVRCIVQHHHFKYLDKDFVTISLGVTSRNQPTLKSRFSANTLVKEADSALLAAKRAGKNQTTVHTRTAA